MAAEDAGTISAQLRLELNQLERDSLDAQKKMDDLASQFKEKGKKGGEMYVQGFGHAQNKMNQRLNNMVSSLQGVSPRMGALGQKMASLFSKPIFAMVPAVSAAFQAMLPIIGTILVAIGALVKVITSAAKKQKEFNDNVKLAREVSAKLKDQAVELNAAQQKSADITARQERNTVAMRLAFQKAGDYLKNIFLPIVNFVRDKFTLLGDAITKLLERLGILKPAEIAAAQAAQAAADIYVDLAGAIDAYAKELKDIEIAEKRGAKTAADAANARLSAADNYLQKLIETRNETVRKLKLDEETAKNNPEVRAIEDKIAAMVAARDEYARLVEAQKKVDVKSDQEKIDEARLAAIEKYEQAVIRANDARKAGLIEEGEKENLLHAALEQKYSDLENIALQYRNVTGAAKAELEITQKLRNETAELAKAMERKKIISETLVDQGDTLVEQEIAMLRAIAGTTKDKIEQNNLLEKAIDLENKLIVKQRQRTREELVNTLKRIAASDDECKEILANFDKITEGMKKTREAAEEAFTGLFGMQEYQTFSAVANATVDVFEQVSSAYLEATRQHAEEQIAIVDRALEKILGNIQKAREAELIAAGFIVQNNVDSLEAQLEAAKRCGDEVLIYLAQRRLEEQRINDKYDAEAEAAQKRAAIEKARIEYEVAKQEHSMKMIGAANAGVMAVLNALASSPPPANFILAGIAGSAAAVQIALLAKNPPKMQIPKFANSGIVPGNKYAGDRNVAAVDSGELILNRAHQDNIADQLTTGGTVTTTIVVMMDSKEIAAKTVELVNKGHYTIMARAVR